MTALQGLLTLAVLVTLVAAVWDHRTGRIPNVITYPLLMVGALLHLVLSARLFPGVSLWLILLETVAGAALCGLVPFLLWRKSAMGGGDVKLLAGLGATLGPSFGLELELYSFLAAVVMAPIVLAYRGELLATAGRSWALLSGPFRKSKPKEPGAALAHTELRFGPAICFATLVVAFLEWK